MANGEIGGGRDPDAAHHLLPPEVSPPRPAPPEPDAAAPSPGSAAGEEPPVVVEPQTSPGPGLGHGELPTTPTSPAAEPPAAEEMPPAAGQQAENPDGVGTSPAGGGNGGEWWRLPPRSPADGPASTSPEAADEAAAEGAADPRWWRTGPIPKGMAEAHEIGVTIGEAVAAHLPVPDVHAAAAKRGLDIRWLRLKYNIPGCLLALLATWGDDSLAEAVARSLIHHGPFALLGWILLPALALGLLMLTPMGGALGGVLVDIIRSVLRGVGVLVARAWRMAYFGYLLRLVVAVAGWSVVITLVRLIGRALIHFLTGA
jgi:hypothetical protein